jgi:hypothetical protein
MKITNNVGLLLFCVVITAGVNSSSVVCSGIQLQSTDKRYANGRLKFEGLKEFSEKHGLIGLDYAVKNHFMSTGSNFIYSCYLVTKENTKDYEKYLKVFGIIKDALFTELNLPPELVQDLSSTYSDRFYCRYYFCKMSNTFKANFTRGEEITNSTIKAVDLDKIYLCVGVSDDGNNIVHVDLKTEEGYKMDIDNAKKKG